jgi:flagellin
MDDVASAAGTITATTSASAITTGSAAVRYVDSAITSVNSQRATFGAAMNQLSYAVDNLSNVKVNAEAARSRVLDTDYAKETSELARTQIIQQAGTAMLAQANQLPQTVLSLLQ